MCADTGKYYSTLWQHRKNKTLECLFTDQKDVLSCTVSDKQASFKGGGGGGNASCIMKRMGGIIEALDYHALGLS